MQKKYKIRYTYSSRDDIRRIKRYILDNFKYRELGENFTKKVKTAVDGLRTLPTGYRLAAFHAEYAAIGYIRRCPA